MSEFPCVSCSKDVRKRQHGVCCDRCTRWQHRTCGTGITSQQYRQMVRRNLSLDWRCTPCVEQEAMEVDQHSSTVLDVAVPAELNITASPIRSMNTTYTVRGDDREDEDVDVDAADEADDASHDAEDPAPDAEDETPDAEDATPDVHVAAPDVPVGYIEDRSFDVPGRASNQQAAPLEESLLDPQLDDVIPEDVPITFQVVEGGSERGGQKLVSSEGYTYTRRNAKGSRVYWTCSVRNKTLKCYASVKQFGEMFTPSAHQHQHPSDPGVKKNIAIKAKVIKMGKTDVFRAAGDIVDQVMDEMTTDQDFRLPKPANLLRAVNRRRQKLRPQDPAKLEFEVSS